MTEEVAKEKGYTLDRAGYDKAFADHQALSKAGAEQKFKGGLADGGEFTARLHSATHLLNAALKKVLHDDGINQKGSNITAERLRFDFNFPRPLTAEEIADVEKLVNEEIAKDSEVKLEEMTVDEARASGAVGVFGSKYGEVVKVYTIGFSKEICGGPHAKRTGELGKRPRCR
jgi:alanyl-tRNA synthetase